MNPGLFETRSVFSDLLKNEIKGRSLMKIKNSTLAAGQKYWVTLIFLCVCIFFTGGCVSTNSGGSTLGKTGNEILISPPAFVSDTYAIHKLKKNETPGLLARHYLGDARASWRILSANPKIRFEPGTFVIVPLKENHLGGLEETGYQTIPILCYHRFSDTCNSSLCIPSQVFDDQMAYLKKNDYTTLSLNMLEQFIQFKQAVPPKSVVITIDDGYRSGYEIAAPILKKYGFTATLFVYSDFVEASRNAVTWEQLRQLKSEGFGIGSHTLSHGDLSRQKNGENEAAHHERIRKELTESKAILDKELDQDTRFIAWPFGRYNTQVLKLSEETGYSLGFSVDRGGNAFFGDPLALNRDQILSRDMEKFRSRLKTFKKAQLR